MSKQLDIIIFGASGFTGSHTIAHLVNVLKEETQEIRWGLAGRSEEKLKATLKLAEERTGNLFSDVPIVIADINDAKSLKEMTSQAKVIINTVGPYRYYGEQVVQACIETSTHYLDVSGEADFQEGVQLKYHDVAVQKKIYLISSCGVGSVPVDLGVTFLQNNFQGTLNSVEAYSSLREEGGPYPGPIGHLGTWESALMCIANPGHIYKTRSKLLSIMDTPNLEPKLRSRLVHKSKCNNQWAVPLPEPDRATVVRSQRYLYQLYNQRPVQIETYVTLKKFYYIFLFMIFGSIAVVFSQFKFTRKLLFQYPEIFSFGCISKEGPTEEKQEHMIYDTLLYGEGWPEKLAEPTDKFKNKPTKTIVGKVSGRNPAYGLTCTCIAAAAVTILKESSKMPNCGGCYPPAAAFSKTTFVERLNRNGVTFEIVSK